jgi:hypothetical protein
VIGQKIGKQPSPRWVERARPADVRADIGAEHRIGRLIGQKPRNEARTLRELLHGVARINDVRPRILMIDSGRR